MNRVTLGLAMVLACSTFSTAAMACGGEVPTSCDDGDRNEARWLLTRAVKAVKGDKDHALAWFSEQSHGYRTADLYVYCIGPNNIFSAHPDPAIRGTDASKLEDSTGRTFAEEMIHEAKADVVSDITYMWPRLESSKPSVKHTMYTRVSDQICAVGYYE